MNASVLSEKSYHISSYSFHCKNSVYSVKIEILRQLFEFASISKFKKRIVTPETIWGSTVPIKACCNDVGSYQIQQMPH